MTTLADLVNEVHLNLLGYVLDQESITTCTSFTDSATSFSVVDASQISTGLIEVDEELMWCTEVDTDSNIVYAGVRGMYGTTAAAHSTGAVVRNSPRFPRMMIANAINQVLRSSWPDVYAVASTNITTTTAITTYQLPTTVELVLDVTYDELSPSGHWSPIRRWALDKSADTTEYPNGNTITVFDPVLSGRSIRVTYTTRPSAMDGGMATTLASTGLEESARPMLVYGACAQMLGYTEAPRLTDESAQANLLNAQTPGAALSPARWFYQLHLQARQEEARRLATTYPPRPHFTR